MNQPSPPRPVDIISVVHVDASPDVDLGVWKASLNVLTIRLVLDNLIKNAVGAMPKGGELRINGSRGEQSYVIEVSDTVEGIRAEVMEYMFKSFHTMKPGGLGLWLACCNLAVEAHGGSITVEIGVGTETAFKVKLPDTWLRAPNHPVHF